MKNKLEETPIKENHVLEEIRLPSTKLDLIEQFALALQARDARGLRQLIDKHDKHDKWGGREGFIKKFLSFCTKMDNKYSGVYVHTVPGQCGRGTCNAGYGGLGVTVNTIKQNRVLWRFNLVFKETRNEALSIWLCKQFEVKYEEIPF
jgi:hypothetical protein